MNLILGESDASPSVVQCEFLTAVHKSLILRKLGELSPPSLQQIWDCLRAALGIP